MAHEFVGRGDGGVAGPQNEELDWNGLVFEFQQQRNAGAEGVWILAVNGETSAHPLDGVVDGFGGAFEFAKHLCGHFVEIEKRKTEQFTGPVEKQDGWVGFAGPIVKPQASRHHRMILTQLGCSKNMSPTKNTKKIK